MNEVAIWNYQASVEKMRPLVVRWKTVTDEMLDELYQARKALSDRGSWSRANPHNWSGYLQDIGLPRRTVHGWLEFWNPTEKKRIEPPPRVQPEPEEKKPKGHTIDDQEYERRKEEALKDEPKSRPLDEIFNDVEKVIKRQENEEVFREFDLDALIDELRRRIVSISNPARRHHAINQIIKAMRELAIECDRLSAGSN